MDVANSVGRKLWLDQIEVAWTLRPIVWLAGVRQSGKTTLARMVRHDAYLSCETPSVQNELDDPERFLASQKAGAVLILDEVHYLRDPSILLKIAADAFSHLRILATGSSTFAASRKFRDTLTGRKLAVHLCPVLWEESREWLESEDLDLRLLRGGLPIPLRATHMPATYFSEWAEAYFARDILALFAVRNRQAFMDVFNLLLRQSGGLVNVSSITGSLENASRPTVESYLRMLQDTLVIHMLRPYRGGKRAEIVARKKCYAFDTGLVAHAKGWTSIRPEDRGLLWEHLVLDALRFRFQDESIYFWRDQQGQEIDFVVRRPEGRVDVIECKIDPERFKPDALEQFRKLRPDGDNFVVGPSVKRPYKKSVGHHEITITGVQGLPSNTRFAEQRNLNP